MTEAVDAMAESSAEDDITAHSLANRRYHFAIFEASGMPHLIRLIRMLWDATAPYRSLYFNVAEHREHSAAEHAEILDAVRAGDAKRAVKLLDGHRQHTIDSLHKIIERAEAVEAASDALATKR